MIKICNGCNVLICKKLVGSWKIKILGLVENNSGKDNLVVWGGVKRLEEG
ncbi:hypothetical protein [Staphylococcus epidermidis]|nr:hypothetical protein [Staphylococcus epidermidis]